MKEALDGQVFTVDHTQGSEDTIRERQRPAEAEYVAAFEELKQEILKEQTNAPTLIDLSDTAMTQKTRDKAKEIANADKTMGREDAPSAVVGLSKLAKVVAQLLDRDALLRHC